MSRSIDLPQESVAKFPLDAIESDIVEIINIKAYGNYHLHKLEGVDSEGLRAIYEFHVSCGSGCRHVPHDYVLAEPIRKWVEETKRDISVSLELESIKDIQVYVDEVNDSLSGEPKYNTVEFFIGKFFHISSNNGISQPIITNAKEPVVLITDVLNTSYPQTVKGVMYTETNIPMGVILTMDELVDVRGIVDNVYLLEALRVNTTLPLDKELLIMHDMVEIFS